MRLTWKMVSLGAWYVILMEGTAINAKKECPEKEYQVHTKEGSICCQRCPQSNQLQPCPDADKKHEECRCNDGYGCFSKSCSKCKKLPICGEYQQLNRTVNQNSIYVYLCEECRKGTFSEVENEICKPGEGTISTTENNRSRNNSSPTRTHENNENSITQISGTESIFKDCILLALYSTLAVFILLLFTIFIHLLIWKMKTTKSAKIAGVPFPPQMIVTMNTKEDADSWSCQFPEEEHGDVTEKQCAF